MGDVSSLLDLIDQYGLAAVLLALLFVVLYKFFEWALPMITKLTDQAVKRDPTAAHKKEYQEQLLHLTKAEELLGCLLNDIEAMRVSLFEYHNGGKALSGFDYQKISNTIEVVARGVRKQIVGLQGLPAGLFAKWNEMMLDKIMIIIPDLREMYHDDQNSSGFWIDRGASALVLHGVYDTNDYLIGFIVVEYGAKNSISDNIIPLIQAAADKLGGVLSIDPKRN